jgi:predicted extracellular nuclease
MLKTRLYSVAGVKWIAQRLFASTQIGFARAMLAPEARSCGVRTLGRRIGGGRFATLGSAVGLLCFGLLWPAPSSAVGLPSTYIKGLAPIRTAPSAVTPIHDIQGSGATSPLIGAVVTTEGIVTARKFNNGFFLQTPDADVDADPNTSQGIFVFTTTAPPADAVVGNRVSVTGTVNEFTPTTNLNQRSITQIGSVTSIMLLSTGNPLPTPIVLSAADFSATSTPGTAEKFEGMRVTIASARVVEPSNGFIIESSATSSTDGVFHVVLDGTVRPMREPGIGVMDVFPIPGGKVPPRFDTNQERIMVRSRGQVGATPIALDADATVTNMTGVLDYFSGTWALLPDAGSGSVSGGKVAIPVSDARSDEVTIASFNLDRFFDEVNTSNGAPTLTAAALDKRLAKTSLAICNFVKSPDILGVIEAENLRVLGLLADRINSTCARAPQYVPYLVQGNDSGSLNVGFLVSNRSLGTLNRVEVLEVTQFGKSVVMNNPDSSTSLLNDRPPLLLRAVINADNGARYPVTVIVNHLRSLNGIDDVGSGSSGWSTESARVRARRGQQALFLADLVQARQLADPTERIVLLGNFNAYSFSDGFVDVMGILRGTEAAEANVVSYFDSPITRPLTDSATLIATATDRYSSVFSGSAESLSHVLLNEPIITGAPSPIRVEHARINADFGVHHYGTAGTQLRTSFQDPIRIAIATLSPIMLNPAALPNGTVGLGYSQTVTASGGVSSYSFAVTSGTPPTGLTLASSGALTGVPTAAGSFTFTITASDSSASPGPFMGSRSYSVVIAQGTQTVTFAPASPVVLGVLPITLSATSTSNLIAFSFSTSSPNTVCTVVGNQLTLVGVGTCALTATQPGNANYASASASANIVINAATQTVTFAQPTSPAVELFQFTVSASGGGSGNPVVFTSLTPAVCTAGGTNGAAINVLGAGTCTIAANQAGNGAFAPAAQVTRNVIINPRITIVRTGNGSGGAVGTQGAAISCGGGCISYVAPNATVNLSLIADPFSKLVSLTGANCPSYATTGACNFAMPTTDVTITLNFRLTANLDGVNAPTEYDAASDGVILLRYLLGYRGNALLAGISAVRTSQEIETYLAARVAANDFDVDGDSTTRATTDGLIILRRMLLRTESNPAVITVGKNPVSTPPLTDAQIVSRVDQLLP